MKKKLLFTLILLVSVMFAGFSAAQAAKTVLHLLAPNDLASELWQSTIIAEYEKENPNVEVKLTTFTLRELEKKIAVALPAQAGSIDVVAISTGVMSRYVEADLLVEAPLSVINFLDKGFPTWATDLGTFDGKVYGVPYKIGKEAYFWNKEHFAEAGISGPPETWDEMIDTARKLVKYNPDGTVERSGISLRLLGAAGVSEKFEIIMRTAGGSMIQETASKKWHANYSNKAGVDTLKLHIDLLHKYKVDDYKVKHDVDSFALGTTSMFYRESWVLGRMKTNAPEINYGVSLLPYRTVKTTIAIPFTFFVPKESKYQKEAWDFIVFSQRPKYVRELLARGEGLPARTKDVDFSDIYRDVPQLKAFVDLPRDWSIWPHPTIAPVAEISTKFGTRLEAALKDESLVDNLAGIRKAIADMAKETNEILKEFGYFGTE